VAYTKLFGTLINSTVWLEDNETRILWITMLAMADKNGEVKSSVPGLCKQAQISLEGCLKALGKFSAPDPLSTSQDYDGRRIEAINGGWLLLNYGRYRRMASLADKKENDAERQRRARERKRSGTVTVTGGHESPQQSHGESVTASRTHHALDIQAEAEAEADSRSKDKNAAAASFVEPAREEISDAVRAAVAAVTPPTDTVTDVVDQLEDAPHGFGEDGQPIRNTPMPVYETFAMPAEMPKAPPPPPPPHQVADASPEARAFNAYNQIASLQGWPQAMFLNTTVRFKMQARLAQASQLMDPPDPIAGWTQVLLKAANADFFRGPDGKAQRWFDLDFLLDEEKFRRLLEGKYDERRSTPSSKPSTGNTLGFLAELSREGSR
jgi:hypothetical protein